MIELPSGALLRPFEDGDLPVLVELLQAPSVSRWWGRQDERRLRHYLEQMTSAWTLEVRGEIAGLITALEEPDPEYRHVELDLFVADAHQNQGLGSEVLRAILSLHFTERGHHRAVLCTSPDNARAIRVYERLGFKPVGILRQCQLEDDGTWGDELMLDLLAGELAP